MKHFTDSKSFDPKELVRLTQDIIAYPHKYTNTAKGKTLGLLFLNPSLRTRLSTQKAAQNLGMNTMVLNLNQDGWQVEFEDGVVMDGSAGEHIREAAQVIGQYCDVVGLRCFPALKDRAIDYEDRILKKFIEFCGRPILSLESAIRHPLQSLADMVTIEQLKKTSRPKVVLSWAPHVKALPQAVANSFSEWAGKFDYDLHIVQPKGYELDPMFTSRATISYDQESAFKDADFIYAKNWSSLSPYGLPPSTDLNHWQIDSAKMKLTNQAIFLHCLPVRRNLVASDEVLDSPQSKVIVQAKNREYSAQAVLHTMLDQSKEGS